jgi:WD40 repeat protein
VKLLSSVAIASDGTWLAAASHDKTVRLWDAPTGTQRAEVTSHTEWVSKLAIAPDGTWLVIPTHEEVRLWNAITGQHLADLTGHTGRVNTVAVGGAAGVEVDGFQG